MADLTNGLLTAGQPTQTPGSGLGGLLGMFGGGATADPQAQQMQQLSAALMKAGQPGYLPETAPAFAQGGGQRGPMPLFAPAIPQTPVAQNPLPTFAALAQLRQRLMAHPAVAGMLGQTSLGRVM